MVAEMERKFIRERQQVGIEAAKAKGIYKGRRPSVPVAKVREMRPAEQGPTAIAKALGISRMSVHRVLTGQECEARLSHTSPQRCGPAPGLS
jgi:DNA invertase Pin-like site-specific DNA recombinase